MTLPGTARLSTYGGEMQDHAPVEDPTTDESAAFRNMYVADAAAMTATIMRAFVRFTGHATTPGDAASNVHGAVWGDAFAVKPAMTKGGTGVYLATFPTEVEDELGVTQPVNLRDGWGNANGATAYHVQVTITAANVATIRVFDMAGTLTDAVGATIAVYVI